MKEKQVTDAQKELIKDTGSCPHCQKAMKLLDAVPAKQELYCEPCHFSFRLFKT